MANPGAGLWDVILPRATVASVVVDARPEQTSAGHHASLHIRPYVTLLYPTIRQDTQILLAMDIGSCHVLKIAGLDILVLMALYRRGGIRAALIH